MEEPLETRPPIGNLAGRQLLLGASYFPRINAHREPGIRMLTSATSMFKVGPVCGKAALGQPFPFFPGEVARRPRRCLNSAAAAGRAAARAGVWFAIGGLVTTGSPRRGLDRRRVGSASHRRLSSADRRLQSRRGRPAREVLPRGKPGEVARPHAALDPHRTEEVGLRRGPQAARGPKAREQQRGLDRLAFELRTGCCARAGPLASATARALRTRRARRVKGNDMKTDTTHQARGARRTLER